jgi:hypothetical protein
MRATLVIVRRPNGAGKGEIDGWWVEDERGFRWEIFAYEPPNFSIQYDTGKSCGTGRFVLDTDQDLSRGSRLRGTLEETPVGEFGVPCDLEFVSAPLTENQ